MSWLSNKSLMSGFWIKVVFNHRHGHLDAGLQLILILYLTYKPNIISMKVGFIAGLH